MMIEIDVGSLDEFKKEQARKSGLLCKAHRLAKAENTSGIRPMEYKVLVLPKEVEERTKGGLILADSTVEKEKFGRMEGTLVAMSPMAFAFDGDWPADADDQKPSVGDKVVFAKYNAEEITGNDDKKYWIMRDTSIIAIME